jgi:hypothetical protein
MKILLCRVVIALCVVSILFGFSASLSANTGSFQTQEEMNENENKLLMRAEAELRVVYNKSIGLVNKQG